MSDYTKSTNFASKDSLSIGNPLKIVKGTEIDTELNNIATAVATKADIVSPTFTGTPVLPSGTTATTQSAGTNTTQLATTAFVKTAVDTYDAALTVSTTQIEDAAVTSVKLASGAAVSNIGFTPVQQGGGTDQLTNKVYIGWTGAQLKGQVDAVDQGAFVMQPNFTGSNQSLGEAGSTGYQKLPGGLIMQWGSFTQTGETTVVTIPIAFPNAFINIQQTIAGGASVSQTGAGIANNQQFVSYRDIAVGNVSCYYFAIGY